MFAFFHIPLEYRAITEYTSDTPGDLSFNEGEKVLVYWGNDNGWWFGAAGSVQGWFPGSYVEVSKIILNFVKLCLYMHTNPLPASLSVDLIALMSHVPIAT